MTCFLAAAALPVPAPSPVDSVTLTSLVCFEECSYSPFSLLERWGAHSFGTND